MKSLVSFVLHVFVQTCNIAVGLTAGTHVLDHRMFGSHMLFEAYFTGVSIGALLTSHVPSFDTIVNMHVELVTLGVRELLSAYTALKVGNDGFIARVVHTVVTETAPVVELLATLVAL